MSATTVRPADALDITAIPHRVRLIERQWRLWRRKKIGFASLIVVVCLVVVAVVGPLVVPHDPFANNLRSTLAPPSSEFWFGTDRNGRDVFSRVLTGARISVTVGFASVVIGVLGGAAIGLISGFLGGVADYAIQRFVDAIMAVPGLVLLLALVSVLEPSIRNLILVLSIVVLPRAIRVVRAEVLVAREVDYVLAAGALGASSLRIMLRHILPNVSAPILIIASVTVGQVIMTEASLSFLGLGIPPPHPTWGNMLSGSGREYMTVAPWLVIAPGIAITLTILAFNMLGDALRDILDPRLRGT